MVSTHGIKSTKPVAKTVYLTGEQESNDIPDNSEVNGTNFKFYFKYNMNEIDLTAPEYIEWVNNVVNLAKTNPKMNVEITASSSKVPTHSFKSNDDLSKVRLSKSKEKMMASLKAKGINASQLTIAKETPMVGGPEYNNDKDANKKTYEKHQYVIIDIK